MATTRSPSPNPVRPTTNPNPNPKTPDSSNLLRKSTTSLSKPSISSDSHLRSSFSKASPCASYEHKENEFDPNNPSKPSKARSPAIHSSKNSKNFMAPTISAASKIIAPSPRKNILQERNEVTPLSDSPFVPTGEEFVSKSEAGVVMEFGLKAKMGIVSPDILDSRNIKKVPSFLPSPVVLAPFDAEPSRPPYDPKTNYLSPRPRFLHYRPNPRIENYVSRGGELHEVGDGRRLEDYFSSESSDDTVATSTEEELDSPSRDDTEEKDLGENSFTTSIPSEVEEKESLDESLVAEVEEKESLVDDSFTTSIPSEVEKEKSFDESLIAEVEEKESLVDDSFTTSIPSEVEKEESFDESLVAEPELNSKPFKTLSSKRSKLLPFLLVMAIVCAFVSLSDSPIISSSMLKEQPFTKIYNPSSGLLEDLYLAEFLSVAKVKLYHWSSDSIAYFTSMAPSSSEVGFFNPVNLTFSDEDESLGSDFIYRHDTTIVQAIEERSVDQPLPGEEIEVSEGVIEDNADKMKMELSEALKEKKEALEENSELAEKDGNVKSAEFVAERIEMEVPENVMNHATTALISYDAATANSEQQTPSSQAVVEYSDIVESPRDCSDVQLAILDDSKSESLNTRAVLGLSSAVVLLASASVFLRMKKNKIPMMVGEKRRQTSKKVGSVSDSCRTYTTPVKGSQHIRANEDLMGDFGHSEASSSLNNTFAYGEEQHHQMKSSERRLRRDSTASSMSYGSFTTYERISAKKGYKDEEVVTPVRRSNRLRNQVTSS